MNATKKEITLGVLVGLAIGIPALVIALLLSRSVKEAPGDLPTQSVSIEALNTPLSQQPTEEAPGTPPAGTAVATLPVTPTEDATGTVTHTVAAGETLGAIALEFDVTVEDLVLANDIEDPDFIGQGTVLTIPVAAAVKMGESAITATVVAEGTVVPELPLSLSPPPSVTVDSLMAGSPAILEGDLENAYPETHDAGRFVVHFTPGTIPEEDLENVTLILKGALSEIEAVLDATIEVPFDVYVAGSLFAPPDQNLRGRSFSASRRFFILHDGTGNRADLQYIATHEMTHLFTWNVFGRPVSAMLSEGAAVYTGLQAIPSSKHLAVETFCRAYQSAEALPRISSGLLFEGHVRDLPNYYAAGCFVQYLIETYGTEKFAELYPTGSYESIYGKTLVKLENEWRTVLQAEAGDLALDADALVEGTRDVAAAYDALFADRDSSEAWWQAYLELDAARMALIEGRLDAIAPHLAAAGY